MTTSGLTDEWKKVSPNIHRVGNSYAKAKFGMVEISKSSVTLSIKDVAGDSVMKQTVSY